MPELHHGVPSVFEIALLALGVGLFHLGGDLGKAVVDLVENVVICLRETAS